MEHEQSVHNLAVEGYLLGQMNSEEREAFESHYFECAICAENLREALQFVDQAREALGGNRAPAASGQEQAISGQTPALALPGWSWPNWLRPQFALAAIGVMAAALGVESLSTIPSLQHRLTDASAPRVLTPTYLRPQTRGEATVLKTGSGDPPLFILDLPESSAGEAHFVIESADGRAALQLPTAKLSGGGEPVTLSIPRLDLVAGKYSLVVTANPGGQELGRYPFEIK